MKHLMIIAAVFAGTSAMAHETTQVVDHYETVKTCKNDKAEGAITGGLLGALLLGTVTNSDQGALAGGLIGGLAGADGKSGQRCTTHQEYSHTTVTFMHNGVEKTFSFTDQ